MWVSIPGSAPRLLSQLARFVTYVSDSFSSHHVWTNNAINQRICQLKTPFYDSDTSNLVNEWMSIHWMSFACRAISGPQGTMVNIMTRCCFFHIDKIYDGTCNTIFIFLFLSCVFWLSHWVHDYYCHNMFWLIKCPSKNKEQNLDSMWIYHPFMSSRKSILIHLHLQYETGEYEITVILHCLTSTFRTWTSNSVLDKALLICLSGTLTLNYFDWY